MVNIDIGGTGITYHDFLTDVGTWLCRSTPGFEDQYDAIKAIRGLAYHAGYLYAVSGWDSMILGRWWIGEDPSAYDDMFRALKLSTLDAVVTQNSSVPGAVVGNAMGNLLEGYGEGYQILIHGGELYYLTVKSESGGTVWNYTHTIHVLNLELTTRNRVITITGGEGQGQGMQVMGSQLYVNLSNLWSEDKTTVCVVNCDTGEEIKRVKVDGKIYSMG